VALSITAAETAGIDEEAGLTAFFFLMLDIATLTRLASKSCYFVERE
jgi:hypothetical protein